MIRMPNDNDQDGQGQTGSQSSDSSQRQTAGQGDPQGQAGEGQSQSPQGQAGGQATDPATGGQTEFTDPRLQGASPAEIEQYVRTLEETTRQQGQRLNQAAQNGQQPQGQQASQGQQGQDSEPLPDQDDFWEDPVRSTQQTVRRELQEAVQPLREDLRAVTSTIQSDRLEQRYRDRWGDWDQMKGYIEALAQRKGIPMEQVLADEGVTETLYFAVKGMRGTRQGQQALTGQQGRAGQQASQRQQSPAQQQPAQQGQQAPQSQQGQPGQQQNVQPGQQVPQHRPSSSPLPQEQQGGEGGLRELTPAEEKLRKFNGMTKAQFLEWQNTPGDEVISRDRPGQGGS